MAKRVSRGDGPSKRNRARKDASPRTSAPKPASAPAGGASAQAGDDLPPRDVLRGNVISDAFRIQDPQRRKRLGLPADDQTPGRMMVELNLAHVAGLTGAESRFQEIWARQFPAGRPPMRISNSYYRCTISVHEAVQLTKADQGTAKVRAIYRIWPDFRVRRLVDRSAATVKADAARRSYDAIGARITWAVIDSGIDRNHPHFAPFDNLGGDIAGLHRDFTQPDIDQTLAGKARDEALKKLIDGAFVDASGHGTHVAGIIAGGLPVKDGKPVLVKNGDRRELQVVVGQCVSGSGGFGLAVESRNIDDLSRLSGMAPKAKLVSLKVLGGDGDSSSNVIRALQYVREKLNGDGKTQRIQGVNLSLGYEFDAKWFACGQSPICVEVNRLVRSGVVVVVAAGNTGYGVLRSEEGDTSTGMSLTINDPGNADLAITVGATHCYRPHTYGVSYFSSKGPTGDGRLKPDLVAPGERITSCAAGDNRKLMNSLIGPNATNVAAYLDDSGTSMAAPHVSGVIAAFLSVRREFIGRPEEVKRIFLESATPLGRDRYFEGKGLVDLMRAIQSV